MANKQEALGNLAEIFEILHRDVVEGLSSEPDFDAIGRGMDRLIELVTENGGALPIEITKHYAGLKVSFKATIEVEQEA